MHLRRLERNAYIPAPHLVGLDVHVLHHTYPAHWHEFHELVFVIAGCGIHRVNGEAHPLRPGDCCLLTPSDFHEIGPAPGEQLRIYNLDFTLGAVGADMAQLTLRDFRGSHGRCADRAAYDEMLFRFRSLAAELDGRAPGRERAVALDLERILLCWHRMRLQRAAGPPAAVSDVSDVSDVVDAVDARADDPTVPAAIQRALAYLHAHFREPLTLERVARQAGLSPNYFSEAFRKATGMPYQYYLRTVRLDFAQAMLLAGGAGVTEAAFASGFNTLAHFERSFRARFGVTPSSLRKGTQALPCGTGRNVASAG